MFGHFGFSYIGLIYLLLLFIPNILWSRQKPAEYSPAKENKVLQILERVGQVGCTVCVLIFSDFNPAPLSVWTLWLAASAILLIGYEICWIRYFQSEHSERTFYRRFCGIPVPLASLPVTAFLLLGIYGKVIWLILLSVIIGVGHIGIHLQHAKAIHLK